MKIKYLIFLGIIVSNVTYAEKNNINHSVQPEPLGFFESGITVTDKNIIGYFQSSFSNGLIKNVWSSPYADTYKINLCPKLKKNNEDKCVVIYGNIHNKEYFLVGAMLNSQNASVVKYIIK